MKCDVMSYCMPCSNVVYYPSFSFLITVNEPNNLGNVDIIIMASLYLEGTKNEAVVCCIVSLPLPYIHSPNDILLVFCCRLWAVGLVSGNREGGWEHNSTWASFGISIVLTEEGLAHLSEVSTQL